jgi:hypothetical protein
VAPTIDGLPVPIRLGERSASVKRGCQDLCRLPAYACRHGGRCINGYVNAHCDCYGTGYEGQRCENGGRITASRVDQHPMAAFFNGVDCGLVVTVNHFHTVSAVRKLRYCCAILAIMCGIGKPIVYIWFACSFFERREFCLFRFASVNNNTYNARVSYITYKLCHVSMWDYV